jgi:hypothetical protein
VFRARYGLIAYIKQITFHSLKVNFPFPPHMRAKLWLSETADTESVSTGTRLYSVHTTELVVFIVVLSCSSRLFREGSWDREQLCGRQTAICTSVSALW